MSIRPVWLEGAAPTASVAIRRATVDVPGLVATAVAAVVAMLAAGSELAWHPGIHATALRSAIETTLTLSALIGAVLLRSRFNETRRVRELLLVVALAVVAVTHFAFKALPALANDQTGTLGIGARVACAMLVSSALLVAAYVPSGWQVARDRRTLSRAVFAGISFVAIAELIDLLVGPGGRPGSAGIYGPLLGALGFVSFLALMAAGYGFVSRAEAEERESWLIAGACFLLGVASLQAIPEPLPPANWVMLDESLRLLAFGLLLVVALRLYGGGRAAHEAVRAERIRIAHDLHDGLAQDLAFIVAYADRLERKFGEAHMLVVAARRALAASRGTIVDLEAAEAPTTEAALREVAAELEDRFGVDITVRVQHGNASEPGAAERRDIVRIAREAIVNAVKHGGAHKIEVALGSPDGGVLLRISDNGRPVGPASARPTPGTGLGMRAMRSRAHSLGGRLIAAHRAGGGTEINVVMSGRLTAHRRPGERTEFEVVTAAGRETYERR